MNPNQEFQLLQNENAKILNSRRNVTLLKVYYHNPREILLGDTSSNLIPGKMHLGPYEKIHQPLQLKIFISNLVPI